MRRIVHDSAGFSLIEVLIALVICGFIVSSTSGLVVFVRRLNERALEQERYRDNLISVERLFRSLVSTALPASADEAGIYSHGSSTKLSLVSLGPRSFLLDGPTKIDSSINSSDGKTFVDIAWHEPQNGSLREAKLVVPFAAMSFSYYHGGDKWSDQWSQSAQLPLAIALKIDCPPLGPPIDIVVRTVGVMPDACVLRPDSSECDRILSQ